MIQVQKAKTIKQLGNTFYDIISQSQTLFAAREKIDQSLQRERGQFLRVRDPTYCAQVVSGVAENNPQTTIWTPALAHSLLFLLCPIIPSPLHAKLISTLQQSIHLYMI